jgi:hypothetical protein
LGNVAVGELEILSFLPFCTAALVVVNTGDVWTGDVATGCGRSSTIGSTAILALDWLQPMFRDSGQDALLFPLILASKIQNLEIMEKRESFVYRIGCLPH